MTIALALERSPSRERATSAVQTNGTKGERLAQGTILPMKATEKMPYRRPWELLITPELRDLVGRLPQARPARSMKLLQ